jgi:hypothetical protein
LLTEVTETTKNDGHPPGRRILIYQNPLFERLKPLKQPVLNYLDAVYFTKINN